MQTDEPKSQLIRVNIFEPDRLTDLNQIKVYRGKYNFKIYKIAVVLAFALIPLVTFASDISKETIVRLTNQERTNNNIRVVVENSELDKAAQAKAEDMIKNKYFEHFSPAGKTPWQFIESADYNYLYAGENLAMDFKTAEGIDSAWMKSNTHRKNILNNKYNDIGIGISKGVITDHETTVVVQMFGSKQKSLNANYSGFIENVTNLLGVRK